MRDVLQRIEVGATHGALLDASRWSWPCLFHACKSTVCFISVAAHGAAVKRAAALARRRGRPSLCSPATPTCSASPGLRAQGTTRRLQAPDAPRAASSIRDVPPALPQSLHALAYGPLPLSTSPSADSGLPDLGATPRGAPRPVTDAGSSSRRRSDRAAGRPRVPARRAPFGSSTDGTGDGTGAGTGSSDRASVARELRAIREALKEQREMHRGMRDEMREERIRGVAQARRAAPALGRVAQLGRSAVSH